ncbi:MAG: hypothetical protein WAW07_09465 [Bacteroidales bacterium]
MIIFPVMAVVVTIPVMVIRQIIMVTMRTYKTNLIIMMMMGYNSMCQQ